MDSDKLLGRAAIIIPVTHVAACSLFLAGYSWGFGDKIGTLFTASDFFTISLHYLVSMYIFGLGVHLVPLAYRHLSGTPYTVDKISRIQDEEQRQLSLKRLEVIKTMITLSLVVLFTLVVTLLIINIVYDLNRSYYLTISVLTLTIVPLWWHVANKLLISGVGMELTLLGLTFAAGLVGLGMDAGFRDRRYSFDALQGSHFACGSDIVLTPVGNRFVSVSPDGSRQVINDKCEVIFKFPTLPKLNERTPAEVVFQALR